MSNCSQTYARETGTRNESNGLYVRPSQSTLAGFTCPVVCRMSRSPVGFTSPVARWLHKPCRCRVHMSRSPVGFTSRPVSLVTAKRA